MRTSLGSGAAVALFALVQVTPACALEPTTFVAGTGLNSNDCTRASPCKTLTGAIAKTLAGGEVIILEPGEYGSAFINKSIVITAIRGGAVIRSDNAFLIALESFETVTLSGLSIEPGAAGDVGVRVLSTSTGGRLQLRNCLIGNYKTPAVGIGLLIEGPSTTIVSDSTFAGNTRAVRVKPQSGVAVVTLDNVLIEKNSDAGVQVDGATAIVLLNNSQVTNNGTGLSILNGGKIFSFRNNAIGGNTTSAAPTPISTQ